MNPPYSAPSAARKVCLLPLLLLALLLPPSATALRRPPARALVRGRQLHGYLLSLAKAGQTAIPNVQRPKAGGALDTKIPGTGLQVDLTKCDQGGTPALNTQQAVPAAQTFSPGESITVAWKTTIPHANPPGVRIAVRYVDVAGDTFAAHVLAAGLQSGQTGGNRVVTLPATRGRAELMWSWESISDGGYYVSCADIQIGTSGNQNAGSGNQDAGIAGTGVDGTSPSALIDEEASTAVIVIGIIVIVGVVVGVGYTYMNNNNGNGAPPLGGGGGGGGGGAESLPRPKSQRPKSVAKGLRGTPASGLPAGWKAAVDGDGDTYYYTSGGRTSWELPTTPA
jgi:hypothetical protein